MMFLLTGFTGAARGGFFTHADGILDTLQELKEKGYSPVGLRFEEKDGILTGGVQVFVEENRGEDRRSDNQ